MIPLRTGVVRDTRNRINDKILSLPLAFFSEERKGDILARVSSDVNEIENSVMSSFDVLFKNPILISSLNDAYQLAADTFCFCHTSCSCLRYRINRKEAEKAISTWSTAIKRIDVTN